MAVTKAFMGGRLRRLREERGLSQVALAQAVKLSPSYLNQLEHNQRPLTAQVLQKLSSSLDIDPRFFSDEDEARLIADLRDALATLPTEDNLSPSELRALAADMPAAGRVVLALHRRYRAAAERADAFAARVGDSGRTSQTSTPMAYEAVRDFFYSRHNYIAELEERAERVFSDGGFELGNIEADLTRRLSDKHKVRIATLQVPDAQLADATQSAQRRYDAKQRVLSLHPYLSEHQRSFQLATQLAFLEAGEVLTQIVKRAKLSDDETRSLARIGLASYFAGALIMPYAPFLEAAERERYDLDKLSRHFGVGFESVCHRVSTLQRPNACGVPFFFVRVDRAGNISKRQSATDFHFSRVGGTCPLWNVYEAFAQPGRILTQLAQLPEGRTYLWIARTVSSGFSSYDAPTKTFAIGLGCDARHAERLVYSKGLDLRDPKAPTKIGAGCKVCEREGCTQRAFPFIGKKLVVDENVSRITPYPVK